MPGELRISGDDAEMRVSYQTAATMSEWVIEPGGEPGLFSFTARVATKHDYWSRVTPQDLCVFIGNVEWRWENVTLRYLDSDHVTATLRGIPAARRGTRR